MFVDGTVSTQEFNCIIWEAQKCWYIFIGAPADGDMFTSGMLFVKYFLNRRGGILSLLPLYGHCFLLSNTIITYYSLNILLLLDNKHH